MHSVDNGTSTLKREIATLPVQPSEVTSGTHCIHPWTTGIVPLSYHPVNPSWLRTSWPLKAPLQYPVLTLSSLQAYSISTKHFNYLYDSIGPSALMMLFEHTYNWTLEILWPQHTLVYWLDPTLVVIIFSLGVHTFYVQKMVLILYTPEFLLDPSPDIPPVPFPALPSAVSQLLLQLFSSPTRILSGSAPSDTHIFHPNPYHMSQTFCLRLHHLANLTMHAYIIWLIPSANPHQITLLVHIWPGKFIQSYYIVTTCAAVLLSLISEDNCCIR